MPAIIPFIPCNKSSVLPALPVFASSPAVCRLPLLQHRISAGFPSPAEDYADKNLDLNTCLDAIGRRVPHTGGDEPKEQLEQ